MCAGRHPSHELCHGAEEAGVTISGHIGLERGFFGLILFDFCERVVVVAALTLIKLGVRSAGPALHLPAVAHLLHIPTGRNVEYESHCRVTRRVKHVRPILATFGEIARVLLGEGRRTAGLRAWDGLVAIAAVGPFRNLGQVGGTQESRTFVQEL